MKQSSLVLLLLVAGFVPAIVLACTGTVPVQAVTASTAQDGNPAIGAIDNNATTRWSAKGLGVYITLDLGKLTKVCSVSVTWYTGDIRVNFFDLSTSLDGTTFTNVYSGNSTLTNAPQIYPIPVTSARYVRLTFNGNTAGLWCSITQISVSAGFAHPGVLINKGQIEFVKAKIKANQEPWKSMFAKLTSNSRGKLTYTAAPVPDIRCGQEKPVRTDIGCTRSRQDALAAWTLSLIWVYTGNQSYATAAINILNAWSSSQLSFSVTDYSVRNGLHQAAWLGEMFTRSAELLKHTPSGWAPADVIKFQRFLTTQLEAKIFNSWLSAGNLIESFADALVSIGVFTDNTTTFNQGLKIWRDRLPVYVYLAKDGPTPVPQLGGSTPVTQYWNQTIFDARHNGQSQETCRDLGHVQMGLAALANTAETALHQGVDLYNEGQERIIATYEFHSHYLNLRSNVVDNWVCQGWINAVSVDMPAWEVGYNHLVTRLGLSLPQTTTLINRFRTSASYYSTDLMMAWDTLTHSGTGWAGLP